MLTTGKKLSIPVAVILALFTSFFPITCYVLSLSLFGLPHIYYELNYIHDRCGSQLSFRFKAGVLTLLCLMSLCSFAAIVMPFPHYFEIVLSLALSLFVITFVFAPSMLCVSLIFFFAAAITFNPVLVLFLMAFIHNLSPWAFLKERRASKNAIIIFILIPICVFFLSFLSALDDSFYDKSQIAIYMTHYIPTQWQTITLTKALFATAVYMQLIHYDSTIRLLPTYMTRSIKLPIPLIGIFTFSLIAFMLNFSISRAYYSVFSSFHAWLEVPVLLAMFAYPFRARISNKPAEIVAIQ